MASFKGVTERFRLTLINSEGDSERVTIQLSLEGMKVLNQDGTRTMRSYTLKDITRWQSTDSNLIIYTRTPVDLEERQMTLTGDRSTIRNTLDTLTCCCMQLAEILANTEQEASSNLQSLVAGGGRSKRSAPSLPTVDQVEYWHGAEKQGWLQSQGDVTKIWRRRWFVLKQGYLFRFMNSDVSESTKPRGVVDLSQVQDVRDGRAATGKGNSIQLKTAQGGSSVCYVCDSETELVEWFSALEGAVAKIVKALAGVSDEPERPQSGREQRSSGSRSSAADWARQLERAVEGSTASASGRSAASGSQMVSVVGYTGGGGGGGRSASGATGGATGGAAARGGSISSYSQVSGAAAVGGGGDGMDDMLLNYGSYGAPVASSNGGAGAGGAYSNAGWAYSNGSGSSGQGYGYGAAQGAAQQGYGAAPPGAQQQGYGAPGVQGQAQQQSVVGQPAYGGGYDMGYSAGYGGAYDAAAQPAGGAAYGSYSAPQAQAPLQQQYSGGGAAAAAAPYGSLIDQVPPQQPAYPYYQQGAAAGTSAPLAPAQLSAAGSGAPPAAAGPAGAGSWQVHYAGDGRVYYFNPATGVTQWDAPAGM